MPDTRKKTTVRTVLGLAVALALLAAAVPADAEVSKGDEEEVRAVIETYFEGVAHYDTALLAKAFHPDAFLFGTVRGELRKMSQEQWYEGFPERREELPPGLWESMKVLSLDMTETTASAKVTMTMPTVRWVDYLSLVEIDGRWWIVNKVFHGYPVEG